MNPRYHSFYAALLVSCLLFITNNLAGQTILYNETSGDLPKVGSGPLFNIAAAGTYKVMGTLATPGDGQDRFQIGIPTGLQITNIAYSLTGGSINGGISFGPFGSSASQGTGNLSLAPYTAIPAGNWDNLVFANFSTGSTWFLTYTITSAPIPPSVTSQPADQSVCEGSPVTFESVASGSPAPTVQWQVSPDNGDTWNDIPGATSADYSFTPVAGENDYQYSAVYTNSGGMDYSNGALLTVNTSTQIATNPVDESKTSGSSVSFSSAATGMPAPYPQWQVSTDNGESYNDISGENSPDLTFTTSPSDDGSLYRVTYDNTCAYQISSAARLTVSTLPVTITSFEIKKVSNSAVIQWVTEQEHNSKGFEILYSTNGINFTPLKWIAGQGNSSSAHTYSYTHDKPASGNNYYQVKQVDIDGKAVLSVIKTLAFRQNNNLDIFPNPVVNEVTIRTAAEGFIRITDIAGKEIFKTRHIRSELNLSFKNFAPGVYFVRLTNESGTEVKKLFKH